MSEYLERFKSKTRWDNIPTLVDSYKLLCSGPECSLSCANIRGGRLSVTATHGNDRHSQVLSKNDMVFATMAFLNSLSREELEIFCKIFAKSSPNYILNLETI